MSTVALLQAQSWHWYADEVSGQAALGRYASFTTDRFQPEAAGQQLVKRTFNVVNQGTGHLFAQSRWVGMLGIALGGIFVYSFANCD